MNKYNLFFIVLTFINATIVGILTSFRPVDYNFDTKQYTNFFLNSIEYFELKYEPLFSFVTFLFAQISNDPNFYFFFLYCLLLVSYVFFINCINNENNNLINIFNVLLFFLITSSWFVVSTTNGIRQGLAMPFLYISLFFLLKKISYKNFSLFFLFFTISLLFHYSVVLFLPFIFFIFLKFYFILLITSIFCIFYIFNINEYIIFYLSIFFDLPLYSLLKNYSSGSERFVGFVTNQFIYTIFFLFAFVSMLKIIPDKFKFNYMILLKIFCLMVIYYVFYGFGPFSNRYALYAWMLIPFILTYIVSFVKLEGKFKLIIILLLYPFAIIVFLDKLNFLSLLFS